MWDSLVAILYLRKRSLKSSPAQQWAGFYVVNCARLRYPCRMPRDYDHEIRELKEALAREADKCADYQRRYETAKHERDELREAVGITTEKLGHSGHDPEDLHDAVGTIERLLEGEDVDCGIEYGGLASKIETIVSAYREIG